MTAAPDILDELLTLAERPFSAMSFGEFVRELGVKLTPAQRIATLVAFDGKNPRDFRGKDRDIARQLFGDVEEFPAHVRSVLVAVCGGRGGKSYVISALRMLHLALTVPLTTLAPGEEAFAICVAPDKRLAAQVLGYVKGAVARHPKLRAMKTRDTADGLVLKRPDGPVSIEVLPASRGGTATRGRSLVGAVLDECAFFRDDTYSVSDTELYKSISPRILRGGQIIIASTPYAELGLLWDFHERNHGHPVDAISMHAPTLLLRDTEDTREYVSRERARDPFNAAREFDAEFMGTAGEAFFDAESIRACIDESLTLPLPRDPVRNVSVGADMGFRSDSSAQVVGQSNATDIVVSFIDEVVPEKKKPLKPSEVVERFAGNMRGYKADYCVADGHYRQSIEEHLNAHGLALVTAPEGANGKAETYQLARALIRERRVRLPNQDRLIRQLKEVTARPTAGGGITIVSPRWRSGGHGDLVSALVLMIWDAARQMPIEPPKVYDSKRAQDAAEWEARIARNIAASERDGDEEFGFGPD